jgi:hypothetical protein
MCSTSASFHPTRIAVLRVPAENWGALPPHLVPPTTAVEPGARVYAVRDGCVVQRTWGTVKCSNDWKVRRH